MKHQSQISQLSSVNRHQAAIVTVARFIGADQEKVAKVLTPKVRSRRLNGVIRQAIAAVTVARRLGIPAVDVMLTLDCVRRECRQTHDKSRRFSRVA
jgi:hypothetical protein